MAKVTGLTEEEAQAAAAAAAEAEAEDRDGEDYRAASQFKWVEQQSKTQQRTVNPVHPGRTGPLHSDVMRMGLLMVM